MRRAISSIMAAIAVAGTAEPCPAQNLDAAQTESPAPAPASEDTLVLLSIDVRTLPDYVAKKPDQPAPQWRTSFGSERRTEPARTKSSAAVDADIVLLQGVTDVPTLRRWFPAGQWRLVVSRQIHAGAAERDPAAAPAIEQPPIPTTAVAVRLRRGLRMTGQDHVLELADALGRGPAEITAAGTAVRVLIDGRQTWALSVLLPENCGDDCPGRTAMRNWYRDRERENVRHVTGGRFETPPPGAAGCKLYGLRLDPAPPPPRPAFIMAAETPKLGCVASVTVAK